MAHISNVNSSIKLAIATDRSTVPTTLLTLTGANNIQIQYNSQSVDTSVYGATLSTDSAKVSASFSASISGIAQTNDTAMNTVVMPLGGNGADAKKEVYFEITLGDGREFTGYGLIENLSLDAPLRDILKFSFSLNGCGNTTYTPAA